MNGRKLQKNKDIGLSGKRPAGRPRRTREHEEAFRRRLVAAARELFVEEGFESVSMRRIAARAGCAPMTIYQYFANKRAVLRHIWGDIFDEVLGRCTAAVERAAGAPEKLRAFARCFVAYWLEHPDHYRVIYLNEDAVEESLERYFVESADLVRRFSIVESLVREAMADGDFRSGDPALVTQTLICLLHGLAHSLITVPEYPWQPRERVVDASLDAVFRGFASATSTDEPA
ncbi:MAG: TetR/AcrR family transcriptional regulator [Candidatus Krumholzibacteriia bacterium]